MSGEDYQGYTTYETFLVGEWIRNDDRIAKIWKARTLQIRADAGPPAVFTQEEQTQAALANALEIWMEGHLEGATKAGAIIYDLANAGLGEVDWNELAEGLVRVHIIEKGAS